MSCDQVSALVQTVYNPSAPPHVVTEANAKLVAFQSSPEALPFCLKALDNSNEQDTRLLFFCVNTVYSKLAESGGIGGVQPPHVLGLMVKHFAKSSLLNTAICRVFGRIAATFICTQWTSCVTDCLAQISNNRPLLCFGALQQLAEHVEKEVVGKRNQESIGRMQSHAVVVCKAIGSASVATDVIFKSALDCLKAWVKIGAVPVSTMCATGVLDGCISSLASRRVTIFSVCIDILASVFAPPAAVFRTAGSLARASLSLDVSEQRNIVEDCLKRLVVLGGSLMKEGNVDHASSVYMLVCDIARQHVSMLTPSVDTALTGFLLSAADHPEIAQHSMEVWVRLEEKLASLPADQVHALWSSVFSRVLTIACKVAVVNADERERLSEVVLSCGQVLGLHRFFSSLRAACGANLDVALWASSCVSILHDGRSPEILPDLLGTLVQQNGEPSVNVARSGCAVIRSYRVFLKNHGGSLLPACARFCGQCLPKVPEDAAKALLALCELCGELLVADLESIAALSARAFPLVNEETACALAGAVAELSSSVSEAAARPVILKLLQTLALSESDVGFSAGVAFCDRSEGRCQAVYAQALELSWNHLNRLMPSSDQACALVSALAIAGGSFALPMIPAIGAALCNLIRTKTRPASSCIRALRMYVVTDRGDVGSFVECCRVCVQFLSVENDGEAFGAYFDFLRRAAWNPFWKTVFINSPVIIESSTELIRQHMHRYESNFPCMTEVVGFFETLTEAASKDGHLARAVLVRALPLVEMFALTCVCGNPLAVRFYSAPLFDLIRLERKQESIKAFARAISQCPGGIDPGKAAMIAKSIDAEGKFRSFMTDLCNISKGREDMSALDEYLEGNA